MLSGIILGIIVTDKEGAVLLFNKAATDILGIEAEKTRPESWPERYGIYLPDGITLCPREQSPLLRAMRGEEADNIEAFVVRPGAPSLGRWCLLTLRPLKDSNDAIQGAVLVIQDITD